MPRLEVELTSARPDGTWTWRKAGARQPKGEVSASLVPDGSKVGDVLKVEADVLIDGIEITSVLPSGRAREDRFERIELNAAPDPKEFVSTQLAPKGKRRDGDRPRRDRGDRPDRGPRPDRGARPDRGDGERGPRGSGERRGQGAERRPRPAMPDLPERPKPKRVRPLRTHRNEVLESLPPEQRPIAEQALQGGIPAVRQALDTQNASNKAQGLPEVQGDELVALAEKLLPKLRAAEWHDRAAAAAAILDEVDLRDLRSVVVAAESVNRTSEMNELRTQLTEGLTRRVEEEHTAWLNEITLLLDADRVVRALRVSSRPPKAGAPLPKELSDRLIAGASASLTAETFADRWATVLDALSFSPVRLAVTATSVPETVPDALRTSVMNFADRLPQIATQFGIDPATVPKRPRRRPGGDPRSKGDRASKGDIAARTERPTRTPQIPAPPSVEPVAETAPDALPETVPEPIAETAPEPMVEMAAEPIAETAPAPVASVEQVEQVEGLAKDDA